MRFHLLMLLVVILVSLGMHGLASAGPGRLSHAGRAAAAHAIGDASRTS